MTDPYVRQAQPVRAVDGDTIDVVIDLGFRLSAELRLRLLGVDTPELRARDETIRERAQEARAFVETWFSIHEESEDGHLQLTAWPLGIRTEKADSFGRYLADVWCRACGENLIQRLLEAGHGEPWTK